MKKLLQISSFFLAAVVVFTACTKLDKLPYYGNGEPVTLTVSNATVAPAAADSNKTVVTFTWSDPKYATDTNNYKFVLQIDTTQNFTHPVTREVLGEKNFNFTGRQLNAILLEYGFTLGAPKDLYTRIVSSYSNNNERYVSNIVKITVTPFADAARLTTQNTSVVTTIDNQGLASNTFSWSPAFVGYNGQVTYVIQYDVAGNNFANAKEIAVGTDLSKTLTQGEMNQTALDAGIEGGTTATLQYRIKATTAQGAVAYSNPVSVSIQTFVPSYHMYLVGSINGWNIDNAWELISDRGNGRWGKVFYSYVKLNAGDEFLFAKKRGDWGSKYGAGGGGTNGIYDLAGIGNGDNFKVSTSGIYRLTIDLNNNKAYVQQKQVGVVGAMQGWNPSSPVYGGMVQRDKFVILTPSNGSDEFKFHDGPEWNNSSPEKARWWGKGAADNLLDNDGNGANLVAFSTPLTRAIWDGTDPQQLKYSISNAQLRLIGGATVIGDWNPDNALNMTYKGNGIWEVTVTFSANTEFKFVSAEGWSFNYGGDGGSGNSGNISKDGPNLNKPAGTYKITVNEYTQTYTIQ